MPKTCNARECTVSIPYSETYCDKHKPITTDVIVVIDVQPINNTTYTTHEACCCECYCADCGSSSDNDEVFCCWNEDD